jgi:glycosyltransferase involved in cell wall biosynthesis
LGKLVNYRGNQFRFFRRDWSESFKFSSEMQRWLSKHVADYNLVHIHAIFSHALPAAAGACRRNGIPYIVRPAGSLEPWCIRQKPIRKWVAWHAFVRRALSQAAAIHYTTEQERAGTESAFGLQRGIVVPNGVTEALSQTVRPPSVKPPTLLALSRIHPKKGLDLLLRVFIELKSEGQLDGWRLMIAGDGERRYVEHLQILVRGTAAEPFVQWTGWLGGDSKLSAMQKASLFVLSSHQENFGIGVLEAMACSTPVLVSSHVGLAADIQHAGAGWVVNLDANGLRAGLIEACSAAAELEQRGAAARTLVRERFTWSRIASEWFSQYETILAQTRKPSLTYA